MVSLRLESLVKSLGGECELPPGAGDAGFAGPEVVGVRQDSRAIERGELFAALPGTTADGARFVCDAVARGASAILSPAPIRPSAGVPNWVHPEARRVAGEAAAAVHGHPSRELLVVAITGTNGKTTTAHLVGQLLVRLGRRPAVLGTTGHRLGQGEIVPAERTTPDGPELQRLLARHRRLGGDSVALEVSSHALDQDRHAGLEVDVAVFTNLSRDHLDYHGDEEAYARAKERLFESLPRDAAALLNADDPASERMARAAVRAGARVSTFGTRSRADLRASGVETDPGGIRFSIDGMGISRTRVGLPLSGRFDVENALAALGAVLLSGASPSSALEGLAAASPAPGRLERVPAGERGFEVFVDFAHNEHALRRVLTALRERCEGRLICVFGCGGERDRGKRPRMGAAVGELADLAVVTSDNPRGEDPGAIVAEILPGLSGRSAEAIVEPDRRSAIRAALAAARSGDVVLIAGKGHETTQVIGARAIPFDDRAVAAEALEGIAARARDRGRAGTAARAGEERA